ncbi:MAG: hypothetical protein JJU45_12825 [Acidimicrobiia bacterium]|nr:hypothetical protein [Acidimicrobiia bacterium]
MSGDDENLSWHEREVIAALRRLANARSQVDALEAQLASEANDPVPDPADLDRLRTISEEVSALEPKARSRFGGGGARQRIAEFEAEQRLVLERLGFDSAEEAFAAAADGDRQGVDPDLLDFARRELEAATREWEAVQAVEVPDEPEPESGDGTDAGSAEGDAVQPDGSPLASVSDLTGRLRRPEAS